MLKAIDTCLAIPIILADSLAALSNVVAAYLVNVALWPVVHPIDGFFLLDVPSSFEVHPCLG